MCYPTVYRMTSGILSLQKFLCLEYFVFCFTLDIAVYPRLHVHGNMVHCVALRLGGWSSFFIMHEITSHDLKK